MQTFIMAFKKAAPMQETTGRQAPSADLDQSVRPSGEDRAQKLLAVGGIVAALGAASCCVIPFALFTLGVSGAWIGNFTALEPYQPIFAALAAAFLGVGFYWVYRKPKVACEDGSYCAQPSSSRTTKIGLWLATVLFGIALGFPKIAPLFL
jgi:mercuric ion transport protein